MSDDVFWIHENATDPDEFGADTPEEAIRLWIRHGLATDEYDADANPSTCIANRVETEHRVFKCWWETVRDDQHLEELRESVDPLADDDLENLKVGDRFYRSVGSTARQVTMTLQYRPCYPDDA